MVDVHATIILLAGIVILGMALLPRLLFGPEVRLSRYSDGLAALAATLTTYGIVELAHGYGFLAVFVAGYMIRETDPEHHQVLSRLVERSRAVSAVSTSSMAARDPCSGRQR